MDISASYESHVNRIKFTGTLAYVDQPSDVSPNGCNGHRFLLTKTAALESLHTLIGMAVSFRKDLKGHDAANKVGIITQAEVTDTAVYVQGFIYGRDCPDVIKAMEKDGMGLSFEMADVQIKDMRAAIYVASRVTFTGAAILLASRAAYQQSSIQLS